MFSHMKVYQVIVLSVIKPFNQQLHLISIKNVHSGKYIFCETCDKQFSTNSNLNKHMKLHSVTITPEIKDKGNFDCPKCGKECSYKRGMNEHMKKVHSFNEVICSTCDNIYKTASDLKRHINDSHAPIAELKNVSVASVRKWYQVFPILSII